MDNLASISQSLTKQTKLMQEQLTIQKKQLAIQEKQLALQEKQLALQEAKFEFVRAVKLGYLQITFQLYHPLHKKVAQFAVVGNVQELGFWEQPVWMQRIGNSFVTTVSLPPTHEKIEWNFCKSFHGGELEIEGGNVRELTFIEGKTLYTILDLWQL